MNRRTLLTLSTTACLSGLYAIYEVLVSPVVSPAPDLLEGRITSESVPPLRTPENRRQAEQFLPDQPWTLNAKYQVRNDQSFVFAEEWETIDESSVRFTPFAMIWRPRDQDPNDRPYTIFCESAVITFFGKFDITSGQPGRIIGGALGGRVTARGPKGLSIDGRDFNFSEQDERAWSDNPIAFTYGPHSGRAHGLELDLIPAPGPADDNKPAITDVRTVRLIKDVEMDFVREPKAGGPPGETVNVKSAGSFEYGVESHVAIFRKGVHVRRPTGNDEYDELKNCDELKLIFEPEEPPKEGQPAAASPKPDDAAGGLGGELKLAFRRLRAEGPKTTVVSERAEMQAWMHELTYDADARVVALRDERRVRLLQRNNELLCPEVTAQLDEDGQIEQATCRGAGKLFSYAKNPVPAQGERKRPVEFSAEWLKQLRMTQDTDEKLDLIEFAGQAALRQPGRMELRAEVVRLWVTPDRDGGEVRGNRRGSRDAEERAVRPRRMLALREVAFGSPQIKGTTDRLEVWFEDGPLPEAPEAVPSADERQQGALRPAISPARASVTGGALPKKADQPLTSRQGAVRRGPSARSTGLADVPDPVKDRPKSSRNPSTTKALPVDRRQPAKEPLQVESQVIRVKAMMDGDDPQVAEVITEGRVHVTQAHDRDTAPLDLRGENLRLWNYAEANREVIHVTGRPAHIRDRGMQLEGADIHFDRGQNLARVEGHGVLRLPVRKGFDGKSLDAPQVLDVFWKEKMRFDGETADFYGKVNTKLNDSEMKCEEMHVTLERRISFSDDGDGSQETDIRKVVCHDGVRLISHEYERNPAGMRGDNASYRRLVQRRTAEGFEFTFDQRTGAVSAVGPGKLILWKRGASNLAGLSSGASAKANKPLQTESAEWEYTRIDFRGGMQGNEKKKTTTFSDRVEVLYGPVERSTDVIDADDLPRNGGWMRCNELELTEQPAQGSQKATIAVVGRGNAELEGQSDQGRFTIKAAVVSFDQSKGLYTLFGDGKRDATLWRQERPGGPRSELPAQRMEFVPSRNEYRVLEASGAQGAR